jgi:hypothetical protein
MNRNFYADNVTKNRTLGIAVLSLVAIVGNLLSSLFLRGDITDVIILGIASLVVLFAIYIYK